MDTFRCLLLFALQIPRLPHGEEGKSKECGRLTNSDAVNSSENVTAPWDHSSNSTYTIKNGFLTEGYCGDGLIASAL